jgi:kynurenine formamidase
MTQQEQLFALFARAKLYDLAHSIEMTMPVSPNHPGFKLALQRRHGDMVRADGGSAANEMMMFGGHTGTHVDALCHVSHNGELYGGADAYEAQRGGKFKTHDVASIPLTACRGVILDIPALKGVDVIAPGMPVTANDLAQAAERQNVEVRAGDALLIRTGWAAHWNDPVKFLGHADGVPGPDESAAQWMIERSIRLTGAETIAYECIHAGRGHALLPVHRMLLVESGIHIIEAMNLTPLVAAHISEFLFVMTPLKIVGATGVPIRPIAVVTGE